MHPPSPNNHLPKLEELQQVQAHECDAQVEPWHRGRPLANLARHDSLATPQEGDPDAATTRAHQRVVPQYEC